MQFTQTGAFLQENLFKFSDNQRQEVLDSFLRGRLRFESINLFLDDCEKIVSLWLAMEKTEPEKPLGSSVRERLSDIQKNPKHCDLRWLWRRFIWQIG